MENKVRVRFAPSPTGALHIGGVRTALYNYLFAKKLGGKMLLRIEDTDQTRFVPGAEEYILESLRWVGIPIDEGLEQGGPHAPYRQSERKHIYQKYARQLLDTGKAYYAFDTPEELEEMRERLKAAKVATPQYNAITRAQMKNSLTLSEAEVKEKLSSGAPYVIRLKVPRKEEVRLNDLIRGWVMVHSSAIDDKVLMKSDGMPTYHLANVVDDHLMEITHVIRGEEWLPSAPLHVLLYQAFGWEDTMPQFAHLPLLLKPDGNGKLSKRDADQMGFPIFPLDWNGMDYKTGEQTFSQGYREAGYLPEALINFLALLGWNPGTQQELFTIDELVEAFSIERVGKAGVKFDINKAKWFNQQYLRTKPDSELVQYLQGALKENNISCTEEKALKIVQLMKERVTFPKEIWADQTYFFQAPATYDQLVIQSKWNPEVAGLIAEFKEGLQNVNELNAEFAKNTLQSVLDKHGVKIGKVLQALRVVITGVSTGPDLMQTMEIIGKQETITRLEIALARLK
ncbi:glutamate--tRNA ligase [Rhodocytophaga rosea]|uniref:Glutamate--tRNA ligase n=1 Tax=Rhodocytophaga rosea TaxID=2704465 RepID=A0A6C0GGX3_9BACT|nr:glutamate--tRNA ligase [Rhodocytophaga rosea]QHT67074.1 glutamate--tRNA ligase [Rhodocytophaga rosea]